MLTRGVCVSLAVALLAAGGAVARTGSHPRFQASIRGENRAPLVGQSWGYVVRAADSSGRPVGGTAVVRVALRGRIVNTIGWFRFNGRLHRWYRWSPALVGTSAVLQAKVVALGGTRTVGYHVRVRGRSSASARGGAFRVTIAGQSRTPVAGKSWRYVVRARTRAGRPLGGTAVVRVLVNGRVVDTVGWLGFKGVLRRTYHWSSQLRGSFAVLQAKVLTSRGSRTAGYRVHVR